LPGGKRNAAPEQAIGVFQEDHNQMSHGVKRTISIAAIVIASVAAGVILTADLGWMQQSHAQQQQTIPAAGGSVSAVTIPSFADVAARTMPAVVSITTTEVVRESELRRRGQGGIDPFDFFFPDPNRRPQEPEEDEERRQQSGGTGFIISPDGYIITNNHVIEDATKVEVHYGEGDGERTVEAKVIGRDPATDIALLKVDVDEQLPTVRLGNSDNIRVGDWALAIGNPLQFENTLTVGVISAKGRSLGISETTNSFENFIQTDAAINFGNSGGPLLNIHGEVIGINTAIRAYAQNLGFATPVNIAKKIYPQLKEKGKVTRGYLGIRIGEVDERTRTAFNLPNRRGAFVQSVDPGPAQRAGIQPGDVIVQIDNQEIRRNRDLIDYVSDQPPGTTIKITLYRNGEKRTINAVTGERPAGPEDSREEAETAPNQTRNKLGISVQDLSPAVRGSYGIPDEAQGVVVTNVKEVSPAGDENIAAGDLITEANGQKITNVEQLRRIVDAAKSGQYIRLYITRYARGGGGRSQSFFALPRIP
jgi:serine protease Do